MAYSTSANGNGYRPSAGCGYASSYNVPQQSTHWTEGNYTSQPASTCSYVPTSATSVVPPLTQVPTATHVAAPLATHVAVATPMIPPVPLVQAYGPAGPGVCGMGPHGAYVLPALPPQVTAAAIASLSVPHYTVETSIFNESNYGLDPGPYRRQRNVLYGGSMTGLVSPTGFGIQYLNPGSVPF